jgi:putative transposase
LIKGKKRHVLVDMKGLLLQALVTPASVQDRDRGIALLSTLVGLFPFLEKLFADSAYQGPVFPYCARIDSAEPRNGDRQAF